MPQGTRRDSSASTATVQQLRLPRLQPNLSGFVSNGHSYSPTATARRLRLQDNSSKVLLLGPRHDSFVSTATPQQLRLPRLQLKLIGLVFHKGGHGPGRIPGHGPGRMLWSAGRAGPGRAGPRHIFKNPGRAGPTLKKIGPGRADGPHLLKRKLLRNMR